MKTMSLALSAILMFAFSPMSTTQAQSSTTDGGIDAVEVVKVTATVEKIDLEHRKVTLLMDDGKKKTFKVDNRVQNLAQVKVGDHLAMSFTEEILIVVGKSNESPGSRRRRTSLRGSQRHRRHDGGYVCRECADPGRRRSESSGDCARSGRQEENHQGKQEGNQPGSAKSRRHRGYDDDRLYGDRNRHLIPNPSITHRGLSPLPHRFFSAEGAR